MSAMYEHPSLTMHVTPDQRDRAENWLKEAFADGRISESEFDTRIGKVLSADNRRELNEAFYGLVHVPAPSQALGVHPAYQPFVPVETRARAGRGAAAFAHFSLFILGLFGPALVYALSAPGSFARREAAKAFNFSLFSLLGFAASVTAASITSLNIFGMLAALIGVGWVVLTIVGGAKAAHGETWTNPVKHVVKRQVLSEE
ncbi:MAG: DUF1707 domain-containing protein [Friedmanniella sp.]|jgi:hypothetical protein